MGCGRVVLSPFQSGSTLLGGSLLSKVPSTDFYRGNERYNRENDLSIILTTSYPGGEMDLSCIDVLDAIDTNTI